MEPMEPLEPYAESDEDTSRATEVHPQRRRGTAILFNPKEQFDSYDEAMSVVTGEKCWAVAHSSESTEGTRTTFRCNTAKKRAAVQCPARLILVLSAFDGGCASLSRSVQAHDHGGLILSRSSGLSEEECTLVKSLFRDGVSTPGAVKAAFRARRLPDPLQGPLIRFLMKVRKEVYGDPKISLADLRDWCLGRLQVPDETHKAYVLGMEIRADGHEDSPDEQVLRVMLSTPNLLRLSQETDLLQGDTTYKILWQGFPVFILGASDANRTFHPFCVAICAAETKEDFVWVFKCLQRSVEAATGRPYQPRVCMADAAPAITAAWEEVFGQCEGSVRCMCAFHFSQAVKPRLEQMPKPMGDEMKANLHTLQSSTAPRLFHVRYKLFQKKWSAIPETKDFLSYMEKNWIHKNGAWFEGAAMNYPSTNNGLESMNASLKKVFTSRNRMSVRQFLSLLEERVLQGWSLDRDTATGTKHFAKEVSLTTPLWKDAVSWARMSRPIFPAGGEEGKPWKSYYAASSTAPDTITPQILHKFKESEALLDWKSWAEMEAESGKFWHVQFCVNDWRRTRCSCPVFSKKYHCKHALGLCLRLKVPGVDVPLEARPVCAKRKRGRPAKAKRALLIQ